MNFWTIKFNPTSLIDVFVMPSIGFGIEKKVKRISIEVDFGKEYWRIKNSDSLPIKTNGIKGSLQVKYFFEVEKQKIYVAAQPFHRKKKYSTEVTCFSIQDSSYQHPIKDAFTVNNYCWGINFILGSELHFKKLIIEPFAGLGFLKRTVKNTELNFDIQNETFKPIKDYPFPTKQDFYFSSDAWGNVTFGLKLGYIIH
jgi:hypothetical protein